jgi:pyruvyltransferase
MLRSLKSWKDRTISGNDNAPKPYPKVDLTYWSPAGGVNFGDFLSKVVVDLILAKRGMTLGDETDRTRQLLAIGSILHFARDGAIIWGAGVNGKISPTEHKYHHLDVRAVRGPLTQEFLMRRGISVPPIYGDPALLLPHLTSNRFSATQFLGPGFVPNLHDLPELKDFNLAGVPVIASTQSWNRCVEAILRHALILSSSLHGIIVAEAYGIPARYVRLTQHEHLYKYEDYYAGTGRPAFTYAKSLAEGVEMGGERPPIFDPQSLLDAFPFDLWNSE